MTADRAAPPLSPAQTAALRYVRSTARRHRSEALARIDAVLAGASVTGEVEGIVRAIATASRVALNFHPDRLGANGNTVAESILRDGFYRNQFESGISNGGLSAFPGGDRDRWEQGMFGGAYQAPSVRADERPKYGALNVMDHPDGPSPRFGSCHLRLRPEVLNRSTFCFGDSHDGPTDVGTIDAFEPVLAALLEAAKSSGRALGRHNTTVASLVAVIERADPARPVSAATQGRALDDYIEAQVHGPVSLSGDAEAIVVDPSFRDTTTGSVIVDIGRRYDLSLAWHGGFELAASDIPEHFRGAAIPVIGRRIAREFGDGSPRLHAEILGRAAQSVVLEPNRWADWGTPAVTLQHIKQLWHVLVRYGSATSNC